MFAVRALDKDKGKNADIVYSLTENPGGFFRIEPDSGIIYLEKTVSGVRCFVENNKLTMGKTTLFVLHMYVPYLL